MVFGTIPHGAQSFDLAGKVNRNLPRAHFPLTPSRHPLDAAFTSTHRSAGECKVSEGDGCACLAIHRPLARSSQNGLPLILVELVLCRHGGATGFLLR